jgi:hypothetical protein
MTFIKYKKIQVFNEYLKTNKISFSNSQKKEKDFYLFPEKGKYNPYRTKKNLFVGSSQISTSPSC